MKTIVQNEKGQAVAPVSQPIPKTAFEPSNDSVLYWLGQAGIFLHSQHTNLMIDPILQDFDLPLLYDMPINTHEVGLLDGLLLTHVDNDHFSRSTTKALQQNTKIFVGPGYVGELLKQEDYPSQTIAIGESIRIGDVTIQATPALHNWQNDSSKYNYRHWVKEDYCGYWITTNHGTIWLPGDSKLLKEHLQMPDPDMILFDFADNPWHITLEGAITLANTYPKARLLCIHWGCVDAPTMTPFNGNPMDVYTRIVNPERLLVVAPGEPVKL